MEDRNYVERELASIAAKSAKALEDSTRAIGEFHRSMDRMHKTNSEKLGELTMDVEVIKNTMVDIKKDMYGNGGPGVKIRVTQAEKDIEALRRRQDENITDDRMTEVKVEQLTHRIVKFGGIAIGINIMISLVFTAILNFSRLKLLVGG